MLPPDMGSLPLLSQDEHYTVVTNRTEQDFNHPYMILAVK